MLVAFITSLNATEALLQAMHSYVVDPTPVSRERVAKRLFMLEDAAAASQEALQALRQQLAESEAVPLKRELVSYQSELSRVLRAIARHAAAIASAAHNGRLRDAGDLAAQITEGAMNLNLLWRRAHIAVMKEQPRHVRHFFSYVCEQFGGFAGRITRLSIAVLNNAYLRHEVERVAAAEIEAEVLLRLPETVPVPVERQRALPARERGLVPLLSNP